MASLDASVPLRQAFFEDLFHTASEWGLCLYEQDWLATQVQRVTALQTDYGLPEQWLSAMDGAAARCNLPIEFCMPSIGFYIASVGMPNVTEIRTSEDFRADQPSVRRRWMEHAASFAAGVGGRTGAI